MKEFNTQICTSIEQSKRLLELGLKPETADMVYQAIGVTPFKKWKEHKIEENFFPAWSLHRLLVILNPQIVELAISSLEEAYEDVIYNISESIKNGYINKEFLNK